MLTVTRRWALGACLLGLGLGTVACVETNKPDGAACSAATIELELALSAESLSPDDLAVCRDQQVTLRVRSAVNGELHVHGYDAEIPELEVGADRISEISFPAARSGQFPVELHMEGSAEEIAVGVLTVHEP